MVKLIRTLVMTRDNPYPPMSGASLRNWQNINIMREFGPVSVFSVSNSPRGVTENSSLPINIEMWSRHYVSNNYTPQTRRQKVAWLLRSRQHYSVDSLYHYTTANQLNKVLIEFQPDLVIFEELWLYKYLPVIKKYNQCIIILDAHNVEASLYLDNQSLLEDVKAKLEFKINYHKIKSIERDLVQQVNQVWTCSNSDTKLLHNLYGQISDVKVVPNGVNVAHYDCVRLGKFPSLLGLEPVPQTLLFTATFTYTPNQVAADLLIDEIFPKLQRLYPKCRLILAGKSPTPTMLAAVKQNPGIVVTGTVPDMRPYLELASVVIVPLLQGGGTRLKILEAFSAGKPVVSTAKGAEGLMVNDGKHLLIRNNVDEIVKSVCEVWENSHLQQELTESAYELVRKEYSWESVAEQIEKSIQSLF